MDDAIIFADEEHKMMHIINRITNISDKYGLKLNRLKCYIMIFDGDEYIEDINNIKVVHQVKYLGMLIDDKRQCFQSQKKKPRSSSKIFQPIIWNAGKELQPNFNRKNLLEGACTS